MLYRMRFDAFISLIFKNCGFDVTASLDLWPIDATPQWIKRGYDKGWRPVEAACTAMLYIVLEKFEAAIIDRDTAFALAAQTLRVAEDHACRRQTKLHLANICEALGEIEKKRQVPAWAHIVVQASRVEDIKILEMPDPDIARVRYIVCLKNRQPETLHQLFRICDPNTPISHVLANLRQRGFRVEHPRAAN